MKILSSIISIKKISRPLYIVGCVKTAFKSKKKKVDIKAQAGRGSRPPPRPSRTPPVGNIIANLTPSPTLYTMHFSRFGLLALGAAAVNAFRDTSPFFLASTSEYV
jgi:hypothetical protein